MIFSEWSSDTGYVIIIEHKQGYLSVYKHNESLNNVQGDIVKAGEVIATVGIQENTQQDIICILNYGMMAIHWIL